MLKRWFKLALETNAKTGQYTLCKLGNYYSHKSDGYKMKRFHVFPSLVLVVKGYTVTLTVVGLGVNSFATCDC
jgi:hypothetical protein